MISTIDLHTDFNSGHLYQRIAVYMQFSTTAIPKSDSNACDYLYLM